MNDFCKRFEGEHILSNNDNDEYYKIICGKVVDKFDAEVCLNDILLQVLL
jgi:hypothetical protein